MKSHLPVIYRSEEDVSKKTRNFFFWTSFTNEPFVALYALAPFILRKELSASFIELSILSALRPVLPIFSFYWCFWISQKSWSLKSNFILAWFLARAPFLLIPLFPNSWYFIFCCAIYELFKKSTAPALMEILKINLKEGSREKNYCIFFAITFIESILFGIAIAKVIEWDYFIWERAFAIAAAISLLSLCVHFSVAKKSYAQKEVFASKTNPLFAPWKKVFSLFRENPDFFHFQCGFMMGGIGLMLAAPVLPFLYVDRLFLSSSEIAIGRSIFMGIGVIFSVYFWEKMIAQKQIKKLLIYILFGFSLYLFLTFYSLNVSSLFYLSNFIYGIAQCGSHLLWNLSGPIFSGEKESTPFTNANILMVGLRGAFIPALSGILGSFIGPIPVILLGALICLMGAFYMVFSAQNLILFSKTERM